MVITPQSEIRNPQSKGRPVIGLMGGIGAGKSLVAAQLAAMGCDVVDADRIGHDLLDEEGIRRAIRERFGPEVFDAAGQVDRRRLGDRVFADPLDREALEEIVHPELWRRVRKAVAAGRQGEAPAVVLDAALLLEKGLDRWCDVMVYIEASEETRRSRAARSRGWDASEVARREGTQVSLKTKQERADYTIDNESSPEHTFEQVREVLSRIVKS